jgi:hypothetical protein
MAMDDSIYIQSIKDGESMPSHSNSVLLKIYQSHLQGIEIVGDRVFAVSDGPHRTELMEMVWWGSKNEHLRLVGRWTLENRSIKVHGFTFLPSPSSLVMGTFYIHMDSSIHVYSLPVAGGYNPTRLKSLNMKVMNQGKESHDPLSTMITFEGITYFLNSQKNVLEAWNMTKGAFFSEIELPTRNDSMMAWTSFALERRVLNIEETPGVRGGVGTQTSEMLFIHLTTDESTFGSQIWSFSVLKDYGSSIFVFPNCPSASSSMN